MKTIVVGYDETESAERALTRAADIAERFGARLIVISVAPVAAGRIAAPTDPTDPPEHHVSELKHAAQTLEHRHLDASFVASVADPADAIVELAAERDADLIVVGRGEPNLLRRLIGSSTSDTVSHHAHRDVLIVR